MDSRASETRTRVKITPRENACRLFLRGVIFTRALQGGYSYSKSKKINLEDNRLFA